MRSPVRKNHNGLIYERDQPDQKELDAGAAQSSMRAGGQHRPDLGRAARRAAHPARADEKLRCSGTGCAGMHEACEQSGLSRRGAGRRMCSGPHCSKGSRCCGSDPTALAWGMVRGRQEAACAAGCLHVWAASALSILKMTMCESRPPFKRRETLVDERNYIWKIKNHELNLSLDTHSVPRPSWWDTLV